MIGNTVAGNGVEKSSNMQTKNSQTNKKIKQFTKYVAAVVAGVALISTSIFFYNQNKKIDNIKVQQAKIVCQQKQDFSILAEGSMMIAEEVKKAKDGSLPVVYLREEQKTPVSINYNNYSIRDDCSEDIILVQANVTPIIIDGQGKKGDRSFIALFDKSSLIKAGEGTCEKKDNIIECSDLKTIEKICEGSSPGCYGGALANLAGAIKEKIKDIALKFYGSLLGNGSCDKGIVKLVDAKSNEAVIVGYNESEMPAATAKGGDCYRAPSVIPPSIGGIGTKGR